MAIMTQQATGSSSVAMTVTPTGASQLESIRIHLSSAGGAGSFTVTVDAAAGSAYDTVILTQDMTSVTNYIWQPSQPISLKSDDKIVIAWANANGRTYGIDVYYRSIAG